MTRSQGVDVAASPPRFSVVIPCYNQGQFIDECLASVTGQTFPPHEIIVVNDGSTDLWTVEHLRIVCQPPVRLIEQENRGLAGARNAGIRAATGDWIVPLDSDDQLAPDALQRYAESIAREPEVDIWTPDIQHFGNDTSLWRSYEFNAWHQLNDNLMVVSSAIRRAIFERASYNERMRSGYEDWEFYIHACCELGATVRNLGAPVFRYRRWGYSMLSRAHERRAALKEQLHRERAIFADEVRLWSLKRQWSPFFAIASDGQDVASALVRQSFQDVRVVDRGGRVQREHNLSAFRGQLGRYLLVVVDDHALARALDAAPFLLENVAMLCESRRPSLVWLVAVDDPDANFPGSVLEPQHAIGTGGAPACLAYLVDAHALFEAPEIPKRSDSLAADLATHVRLASSQPEFVVVAGARMTGEATAVPMPLPVKPPRPLFSENARMALGTVLRVALGERRKEALMHWNPVLTLRRAIKYGLRAARATHELRDGPFEAKRLRHHGTRHTDWLTSREPARFAPSLRHDEQPALLVAVPWITHGGADRAVVDLVQGLSREAPDLRVFLVGTQKTFDGEVVRMSWAQGVLPYVHGYFNVADLAPEEIGPALVGLVERLAIDTLLIDQSLPAYEALPILRQLPRRVRVVAHLHSFARDHDTGERAGYPVLATSRYDNLIDAYVTVSKSLAHEIIRDFYVTPSKVHPILLGIDETRFRGARRERLTRRPATVLWLGRLSEEKDPIRLLEIARAWREKHGDDTLRFLMAGAGPLATRVQRTRAEYGLEQMVQLPGAVADPVALFEHADCLILTSRYEGTPLVILEAMTAALPIVTTIQRTAIPDIVSADDAWFVEDQRSIPQYIAALEEMLANPQGTRERAQRLAARSEHFTVKRYTREMFDVLMPNGRASIAPVVEAPRSTPTIEQSIAVELDGGLSASPTSNETGESPPTVGRMHGIDRDEDVEYLMHLHRYQLALAFAAGRKVLDFGTGAGDGAHYLAPVAASVLGTDIDAQSIRDARKRYVLPNLRYDVADAAALSVTPDASFDLITCFEVIEHVEEAEQRRIVSTLARLLHPEGVALISTPDATVKSAVYARFPSWRRPFRVRELTSDEFSDLLREVFPYIQIIPQTIEIASLMRVPISAEPPVRNGESWANVAIASHREIDFAQALPGACLPLRAHSLQDLLERMDRLNAEWTRARELVEELRADHQATSHRLPELQAWAKQSMA